MTSRENLSGLVDSVVPHALKLRRLLHQHPEPSYEEHLTTALIIDELAEHGIVATGRHPRTGLSVEIGDHPLVAFRADIDALPIEEPAENTPCSLNPGWMHACGHDAHAAIAFGICLALSKMEQAPSIRVLFQPAEESYPGGAVEMVGEGLADGLTAILAFHVDPALEAGLIGARVGPITASADKFVITLRGPGGHTARPHRTVDLITAAARVVVDLPTVLRAGIDPRQPLTLAFGAIHGGQTDNVIPTRVEMKGTVRTLDRELWDQLPGLMDKVLSTVVAMTDASYELEYLQAIPPVINDHRVVSKATTGINRWLGEGTIKDTATSMGGEDFANYLDVVPGALLRLGAAKGAGDLHSSSFLLDEAAIGHGIKAGLAALLELSG
ncbi:MAG: amidohydrolase [Acidimicrobiia bacterium]|nr:amidohydrolase [Acidimicrobiia bacterium]